MLLVIFPTEWKKPWGPVLLPLPEVKAKLQAFHSPDSSLYQCSQSWAFSVMCQPDKGVSGTWNAVLTQKHCLIRDCLFGGRTKQLNMFLYTSFKNPWNCKIEKSNPKVSGFTMCTSSLVKASKKRKKSHEKILTLSVAWGWCLRSWRSISESSLRYLLEACSVQKGSQLRQ